MKKILTTVSTCAVILAAAFIVNAGMATRTFAQADENQSNESSEATSSAENYEYIAQPGDTYSQMARKAVQTYGIETNAQIGAAGVVFAETNLANLAGWPVLNEGQTVTISKASVKEWFDKAANLTAEEKAGWDYYVPFIDFNTNNVGETPKN